MTLKTNERVLTIGQVPNGESLLTKTKRPCQIKDTQTRSSFQYGDMRKTWTYCERLLTETKYPCQNLWKF